MPGALSSARQSGIDKRNIKTKRRQNAKANFRREQISRTKNQGQFPLVFFLRASSKLARISKINDMDQSVVRQLEFTESVKCMTFPGQFLRLTYSSGRKNPRTRKTKNKNKY